MTSFIALRGDESKGMLGAVASISDGVASSLGRLLPSPRTPQKASPRKDTSASAPARQATPKVTHRQTRAGCSTRILINLNEIQEQAENQREGTLIFHSFS